MKTTAQIVDTHLAGWYNGQPTDLNDTLRDRCTAMVDEALDTIDGAFLASELRDAEKARDSWQTHYQIVAAELRKERAQMALARGLLDSAETMLCNAVPMPHCGQAEWDKIVADWRGQKNAAV